MPLDRDATLKKAEKLIRQGRLEPAIAEYVPGYEFVSSQALFVPAKTPREIVGKISADTNTALSDPVIRNKLAETGYMAGGSSPEELGKLLRSEIARWSELIKSVGIKLD